MDRELSQPQLPPSTHVTLIMKDHAFDAELDDLGQPLEEVDWQADVAAARSERERAERLLH